MSSLKKIFVFLSLVGLLVFSNVTLAAADMKQKAPEFKTEAPEGLGKERQLKRPSATKKAAKQEKARKQRVKKVERVNKAKKKALQEKSKKAGKYENTFKNNLSNKKNSSEEFRKKVTAQ